MAIMLDCRIERIGNGVVIALPYAAVERTYMLLDALMCGNLRELSFRSGGTLLACRCGDEDVLTRTLLTLSEARGEEVKAMLLRVALHPQEAEWLHVDVEAAGGDVAIRVTNP